MHSVLLYAHSELKWLTPGLAEELRARYDSDTILVCNTEQDRDFYRAKHPSTFKTILRSAVDYGSLQLDVGSESDVFREARKLEREFNFRFTDLIMNDRHMGIGFSPGGLKFAVSKWSRLSNYAKAVRTFSTRLRMDQREIEDHNISLIINPPKSMCVVARHMGIPVRFFTAVGYDDYFSWFSNEYMESNILRSVFDQTNGQQAPTLKDHYPIYKRTRTDMLDRARLTRMLREFAYEVTRYHYYRLRGYEKARGMVPFGQASAHYNTWAGFRELKRTRPRSLSNIKGRKYIYFPLGTEPEVTLTRDSPEFNHQEFAIQAIAKELPAGALIVVKEHLSTIGNRPRDFYRDLAKIPNLVFLDPTESGLAVMREAVCVATLNGTSGFEAAVQGISSIVFGCHARYLVVDHAHEVRSWHELRNLIDKVFYDHEDAFALEVRKRDGRRLLQATVSTSVDCVDMASQTAGNASAVKEIVDLLLETLKPIAPASKPSENSMPTATVN